MVPLLIFHPDHGDSPAPQLLAKSAVLYKNGRFHHIKFAIRMQLSVKVGTSGDSGGEIMAEEDLKAPG